MAGLFIESKAGFSNLQTRLPNVPQDMINMDGERISLTFNVSGFLTVLANPEHFYDQ
jgi:hypothetical protein